MSPYATVCTALALGAMLAAAGAYAIMYCAWRLYPRSALKIAAIVSYLAMSAVAVALVALSPLTGWWKLLIIASCAVYTVIPEITWRYLKTLHRDEERSDAARRIEHTNRNRARVLRGA